MNSKTLFSLFAASATACLIQLPAVAQDVVTENNTVVSANQNATVETQPAEVLVIDEEDSMDFTGWYLSPGIGYALFEGDEPLENGFFLTIRLGRDINEWWSIEGSLLFAPTLDENTVGNYDERKSQSNGEKGFGDTWMTQLYVDMLFHFTRYEKIDPYLTFGAGASLYGEDVIDEGSNWTASIRGGGGIMYHINEQLALRADARVDLAGYNTEFNATADIGFVWTFGMADIENDPEFDDSLLDSDKDGLTDRHEYEIGTNPNDPDTDHDGLLDGEEVNKYGTDPTNADSDYDFLSDGAEILTYKTNPLDPDTDHGGVRDGHEVLVDKTNPLDASDDVMLVELYIQFDTDKSVIKPEYFADLDRVAKVLVRNPGATAIVEGHADRRQRSNAGHNMKLSKSRANSVRDYLVGKGLEPSRLSSVGYGFEQPKYPNDPVTGNPKNRRVDVYIYGVNRDGTVRYVNP